MIKIIGLAVFFVLAVIMIRKGYERTSQYNLLLCVLAANIGSYFPNPVWKIVGTVVIFAALLAATQYISRRKAN